MKVYDNNTMLYSFTLDELKTKLKPHDLLCTISCAGNRRKQLIEKFPEVQGNDWYVGGIGNAKFRGVLLSELLTQMDYDLESIKSKHLLLRGLDKDSTGQSFEVSIPITYIADPLNEIILAYEMNDEELTLDHGYPLRVVAPGIVGIRCAKWIESIALSDEESSSYDQKENYKLVKGKDLDNIDYTKLPPLYGVGINSAICSPIND